jgi:hypothetical protein
MIIAKVEKDEMKSSDAMDLLNDCIKQSMNLKTLDPELTEVSFPPLC